MKLKERSIKGLERIVKNGLRSGIGAWNQGKDKGDSGKILHAAEILRKILRQKVRPIVRPPGLGKDVQSMMRNLFIRLNVQWRGLLD